jgi:hypothetical protein
MTIFQPRALQIPNMRTSYAAENSAFANLGETLGKIVPEMQKRQREEAERTELARLGKGIADGTLDYQKAAGGFAARGRIDSAVDLLKLGETAKTKGLAEAASRGLMEALGSGLSSRSIREPGGSPNADTGSALPSSLNRSESGGNWGAQNDAMGAGGQRGHFGRAQFGLARMQEAADAGAIPQGTTPEQFRQSPDLQRSAENWHFASIDRAIKANGFDRLVGQQINGVPITIEGLRAVAHLGGERGMQRFVESGGGYNPADRNGTSLMDYFRQHGGRAERVAEADIPASGARPVSMETGAEGFAVPGAPAMNGRTFDAVTSGEPPLRPAFEAEGVSQPWMGTALQRQPAGNQVASAPLPPPRPYDLAADLPAPGAVPAIGQMPQAPQPDLTNAEDGGSRAFAMTQGKNAAVQQPQVGSPVAAAGGNPVRPDAPPAASDRVARADLPAPGAVPAEGQRPTPVLTADMPKPTNGQQAMEFYSTKQMENAKGQVGRLATALANPNLPANARAVGEIFLKDALEQSKAPDSVKEFVYARSMGWTTAKNPAEYAKEKTKTSPAEETEGRKSAAAAAGLKPGDAGYQGYILTGKMPREDAGPLSATDKKAILEADEGVLAAQTAIQALNDAKKLSPRALSGFGAGARATAANNLPDWAFPDALASKEGGAATSELENVVTSQALAQLKSIFGAAPTEGERKILLDIQGSIGQPDAVRQKIYDRGIALAEKRLGFNQQRANELRGGDFYKAPDKRGQGQPQASISQTPSERPQGRGPIRVATPEEAYRLPKGTPIILPDGREGVVP